MIDNQLQIDEAVVGIAAAQTGTIKQNSGDAITVSVFQGCNQVGESRVVR
jgi:hypothetical protein